MDSLMDITALSKRTALNFGLFLFIAVAAAIFVVSKGEEQIADLNALEDSVPFITRRQLLSGQDLSAGVDISQWPMYKNSGKNALSSPPYALRRPPEFRVEENKEFSSFFQMAGSCRLSAGFLGREIDFVVKQETREEVKPFTVAILELGDQWAQLKKFRYYLFTNTQRGVSIEGEADDKKCVTILKAIIGTFQFVK